MSDATVTGVDTAATGTGSMNEAHATAPATMTARPSIAATVLAVAAAVATVVLLGVAVVPVVVLSVGGLAVFAGGMALRHREWTLTGLVVAAVGAGASLAAAGLAGATAGEFSAVLWTVPGVLGITLLGFALVPLRGSGTRWLVKAGAGGLGLSVGFAGLFRVAGFDVLLLAMVGTVLAWDAGEHAIDVGRQLGRAARTWRLDVAHVGASAVVGGLGVLVGHGVAGMQTGKLSLGAFLVLGVALVALTVALHR